jgi:hypothetical protein
LPGLAAIAYATVSGTNSAGGTLAVNEYATASMTPLQTFPQFGGQNIRFDPTGTLWFDTIGEFVGYRPDGSTAGTMFNVGGGLLWFDAIGNVYTAEGATNGYVLQVFNRGAGGIATLVRSITMASFPCSAVADRGGNIYLSTCTATINGQTRGEVVVYGPLATGDASPLIKNAAATGPVTVDPNGNVYAIYNGTLGVWVGGFTAGPPAQSIAIGQGVVVYDIAADRDGNAYVITRPAAGKAGDPSTLLFIARGATSGTVLQTGLIDDVAVPVL